MIFIHRSNAASLMLIRDSKQIDVKLFSPERETS